MSANECIRIDKSNKLPVAPRLDHNYTRLSGLPWHPVVEPMDVFLRIHGVNAEDNIEQVFHTVDNENTLVIHSPPNPPEACNVGSQAFRYSKIFPEGACPKTVCDTAFQGVLDTVAKGDNFLVFNYGTTTRENSITIQGTETDTGLVPSAIEALFKRIHGKVSQEIKIKPQAGNCIPVGPLDAAVEHELRRKILKRTVPSKDCDDVAPAPVALAASEKRVSDATSAEPADGDSSDLHHSIWVSCVEVYNELIYDLLDTEAPKRRVALRLYERANRRVYVKDAKEVCVFTAAEAIELFSTAQENLRRATSHLPEESSLSHCIFTVRIVSSTDGTWFKASKMNQITFCNLASFEKVLNAELGVKGKAISTSIIALGKCLEAIRSGDSVIPYKESKLTRLLQNYFTGFGRALMVVNINLRANMFDATIHVLTFSALKSKVLLSWPLDFLAIPFRPTRCSIELLRQILTGHESESWISPNLEYTQCDTQEDPMQSGSLVILDDEEDEDEAAGNEGYTAKIHDLVELIQLLQQSLITEKMEKMQLETDCRKELCSHFAAQMRVMEDYYMDRIDAELDDALSYPDKRRPNKRPLRPARESSIVLPNGHMSSEDKDSYITELEAIIANLNSNLETALDSESEAQQKILGLDDECQQLKSRVKELEVQLHSPNVTGKTFTTDSQAQELIAALQMRICKQQHQSNVNETLLNQQLSDMSERLRAEQGEMKTKDETISLLEEQISELQANVINDVRANNATVKEEVDQFQRLLDSVQDKLNQSQSVVDVLSKRCNLIDKRKESANQNVKQLKASLRDANERIDQLETENTSLLDTLEVLQRMLLKATNDDSKPMRSARKCAASGNPSAVTKKKCRVRTDTDRRSGKSNTSSEEDEVLDHCLRSWRLGDNSGRTQHETEERIRCLETELAGLKAALKQTLEKEGQSQKLPAILRALELGLTQPEGVPDSPSPAYRLRHRPGVENSDRKI